MLTTYLLTAWIGTGFFYLPFPSPQMCITAMSMLDYRVAYNASCTEVEQFIESNNLAPETAPVPRARPRVHKTNEWRLL